MGNIQKTAAERGTTNLFRRVTKQHRARTRQAHSFLAQYPFHYAIPSLQGLRFAGYLVWAS